MKRRLAAILVADVVGYSRLMAADEALTLAALKERRKNIVEPLVRENGGRIVKFMGDGVLVEFASAVNAVGCALDLQRSMAKANEKLPDPRHIVLRIGVNLGEVVGEGSDIFGDGVNIAARLEGHALPGGICISGKVHDEIRGKLDFSAEDLGEVTLKNIARPVRSFRITLANIVSSPVKSSSAPDSKPSIAVLPFTNMSGDPEQEYFSDGITEDLITELSRFRELAVVSRTSSFVFKGKTEALKQVGEKLNVQYVVEGSVRKVGGKVRVTAQLIDAQSDMHTWAERYERDLEDIFAVQDDLVRRVTSTLVGKLESERQSKIKRQSPDELQAYDHYLRGREHLFNWSVDENRLACDCLRAAITIAPEYAAALALLSEALLRMWLNGWSERPVDDLAESLQLAKKADEIDDQDSRTQTALGMAYLFQRQPDKAKRCFETALELNANDMRALIYYSRYVVFNGDTKLAVELCRQAMTLNPFGKYNWNLGIASFVAHQYAETITLLESIRNPPESVLALLAASYAMAGNAANADAMRAQFLDAARTTPVLSNLDRQADWQAYFSARWPFRDSVDLQHLLGALRKARLPV